MPPPAEEGASVLVALVNDRADLDRAREEGWYRIPVARAPRPLASDYLAFYLSGAFAGERWAVRYLAEVWGYDVRRRLDLIPDGGHPRARQLYYRVALGPVRPLARPVPAGRLRRLSFIHTDIEHLLAAEDVRDLWLRGEVAATQAGRAGGRVAGPEATAEDGDLSPSSLVAWPAP